MSDKAKTIKSAKEMPPIYYGYDTFFMGMDQGNMVANVSFIRPLEFDKDGVMNLEIDATYFALLNWGIFTNTKDEKDEYVYGSESLADAQEFTFYTATYG